MLYIKGKFPPSDFYFFQTDPFPRFFPIGYFSSSAEFAKFYFPSCLKFNAHDKISSLAAFIFDMTSKSAPTANKSKYNILSALQFPWLTDRLSVDRKISNINLDL